MRNVIAVLALVALVAATFAATAVLTSASTQPAQAQVAQVMKMRFSDMTKTGVMQAMDGYRNVGYHARHSAINYHYNKRDLKMNEIQKDKFKSRVIDNSTR